MAKRKPKLAAPVVRTAHAVYAGPTQTVPVNIDSSEIVAKIGDIKKAFEAFKAENDKHIGDLKKGLDDVVTREKVDRINADISKLDGELSEMNKLLAALRTAGNDNPDTSAEAKAHRKAFNAWARKGSNPNELRELEVKAALQTDSSPEGGYTVPVEMDRNITRLVTADVVMRQIANVMQIGTPEFTRLHNLAGTASGWVGETGGRPTTATPTLSQLKFETFELYANPAVTQRMLDDSFINVESFIADEVRTAFAEIENQAFVTGDGANKPKGLFAYDKVANASWAWGSLGFVATGVNGGFNATDPADVLIDATVALKPSYRSNARWLMNRNTVGVVRKFKDAQKQYLWQPSIQVGQPSTLLGYAVAEDDHVPAVATGAYPIAFGDFRRGYRIVDRVGIRVLRDPFTAKPYVLFYTTKRVGGGIQDFEAFKLIKFAA